MRIRRPFFFIQRVMRNRLTDLVLSKRPGLGWAYARVIALWLLLAGEQRWTFSSLWSQPTWLSTLASLIGIRYNVNHLGNTYALTSGQLSVTQQLEHQVIEALKRRLAAQNKDLEGYVTAGGSESNLFMLWAGREWLKVQCAAQQQYSPNCHPFVLILTDFTHYSIRKAGQMLSLLEMRVAIDETNWSMSRVDLRRLLNEQYRAGRKGFCIPLTIGYSSTGTMDNLEQLIPEIELFVKEHADARCFVWIDAAMQGMAQIFLNPQFKPFHSSLVQGLVIDFHKLGATPLPTGVVIYQHHLRGLIERKIDYLLESDATVSGSRPGFAALAIWANLFSWQTSVVRKRFLHLEQLKKDFIEQFRLVHPQANLIHTNGSLTMAIVIDDHFPRLTPEQEARLDLQVAEVSFSVFRKEKAISRCLRHYKLHFLHQKQSYSQVFFNFAKK